jgi:hypothetical protein
MIMGTIATYNGYVIGKFIKANPTVDSFSTAGEVLFKIWPRFGRELFAAIMVAVLLFIMAAHIVGFQVMMIVSFKIAFVNLALLIGQDSYARKPLHPYMGSFRNCCTIYLYCSTDYAQCIVHIIGL